VAETEDLLWREAEKVVARGPDVVEWRADYMRGLEPEAVPRILQALRERVAGPLLFTCRASGEGGARGVSEPARVGILEAAVRSGQADLVDVELSTDPLLRSRLLRLARDKAVPMVVSTHDFRGTPEEPGLLRTLALQQETGAAVAKIATMAQTPQDGLRLLAACARARAEFLRIPLVGIAMGPAGAFTRVLGPLFGIDLTFAVAVHGSAPGQIDLQAVREARRILEVP
jgi:3-dehydroquinate dehydratase-1